MSQIELKNVNKTYGKDNCVIDHLDLTISDGSFTVMVGPSGCGKSTTLRMIAGLEDLSGGDLYIDGARMNDVEPGERNIAMVFQNYALYPTMNVKENIEFGLINSKVPKEERERRIMDAAVLTGMDKFLDQNPYDFPLSVRKFVTIASVIASGCEVLIFDEPTAGQDLDGLERLSRLIRELTARGKALITITHDMEFVAENFERLIIMCNKKIVADGRTDEVFYYKDIMEEAKLKQPCVVEVSDRIGAGKLGLDLEAVARFIKENRRNAAPSAQN